MEDKQYGFVGRIALHNDPAYINAKLFCKYFTVLALSLLLGIFLFERINFDAVLTFKTKYFLNPEKYSYKGFIEFYKLLLDFSLLDIKILLFIFAGSFTMFGGFVALVSCASKGLMFGLNCAYILNVYGGGIKSFFVIALIISDILISILISRNSVEAEKFSLSERRIIISQRSSEFIKYFFGILLAFLTSMGGMLIINSIIIFII